MSVKAKKLDFSGLREFEPSIFPDSRGTFYELWNERKLESKGIYWRFVQDNVSCSNFGVIRGLHFQNPKPQGKLVSVLEGEVFDVVVDLRVSSQTFKKWKGIRLSSARPRHLFIPPGFAHGFQVSSKSALVVYKCTQIYEPATEVVVRWDDPQLRINWPIENPILSRKDLEGKFLSEISDKKFFQ